MTSLFTLGILTTSFLGTSAYATSQQTHPLCPVVKQAIHNGEISSWYASFSPSCKMPTIELDPSFCELGKFYIENDVSKANLPKASNGLSTVYLLSEIVIKKLNQDDPQSRRAKDELALKTIQANGYQHLIVPASCVHGAYSINERLPISQSIEGVPLLYYQHQSEFTEAIKELTGFILQRNLGDLTKWGQRGEKVLLLRFDNLAPYLTIENGKLIGKLGFVDLEDLSPVGNAREGIESVIRFFPYHFEECLQIAHQMDPTFVSKNRRELEDIRDEAIEFYKDSGIAHYNFLIENGISIHDSFKLKDISMSATRQIKLQNRILHAIRLFIQEWDLNEQDVNESLFSSGKIYELSVELMREIKNKIENKSENNLINKPIDIKEIMRNRTCWIRKGYFLEKILDFFEKCPDTQNKITFRPLASRIFSLDLLETILETVLQELVNENDIVHWYNSQTEPGKIKIHI